LATCSLVLCIDRLASGASFALTEARPRAFYVAEGAAHIDDHRPGGAALSANSAAYVDTSAVVSSTAGAVILRWEVLPEGTAAACPSCEGVESREVIGAPVQLSGTDVLLRCDRVDFPPGGVAYLHTHQGPGIRCLLKGTIQIQTEGRTHDIAPYGAWFESGPAPVLALASKHEETAFARVMLLPTALKGKSSIAYVNEEDRAKPKSQTYQVFLDQPFDLPRSVDALR